MPWDLAEALKERAAEKKRLEAASKAADYYFKSLPEDEQKKLAPSPEEWGHLSLKDRAAAAGGHSAAIKVRENLAQIKGYGALEDDRTAKAESRRQDAADEQTIGAFTKNFMTAPAAGPGGIAGYDEAGTAVESAPSPYQGIEGRMRYAAEQTENLSGRHLPRAIEAVTKYMQATGKSAEDLTPQVWQDPKTGMRIYRSGKMNIPTGVDPESVAASGGPTIAPDGEYYHDGKRWIHIKESGAPAGSKFVTVNGAVALMAPDGRVMNWKMENPIAPMMREIAKPADKAPAAAPAPAAKAKPATGAKLQYRTGADGALEESTDGGATWKKF